LADLTFPPLPLEAWQPTRDSLNNYARVLGKIRQSLTPPQSHWWHVSLRVAEEGLTTTEMPGNEETDDTLEIKLDLVRQMVVASTGSNQRWAMPLSGQPAKLLADSLLLKLVQWDIYPEVDRSIFVTESAGAYDAAAAGTFLHALTSVHTVFQTFKAELDGRTSPVQIWPHHFDLSLVWFSGNLVPGVDPTDEEYADEQMAFGFSTGDEGIPEPYFYVTAYPWPAAITQATLPAPATWYTESWKGALLRYGDLVNAADPGALLQAYLTAAHAAGSALMLD
jgi:hypothetical protein